MAQFTVNPHRLDPYKQFKFRVKWDGNVVAGVSEVGALKRTTEVVEHREGGEASTPRKSPGATNFEPVTLRRGRTHDPAFEEWARKVWSVEHGAVSLADFRKDIVIELLNEAGQPVMAFRVFRCWPSAYVALGGLDANDTCVAFESLTLEHEGWERDAAVAEPEEPSF